MAFTTNFLVTPEHVMVCSPEKTDADGIYILYPSIQNGHIVYKQIENVPINEKNQEGRYFF